MKRARALLSLLTLSAALLRSPLARAEEPAAASPVAPRRLQLGATILTANEALSIGDRPKPAGDGAAGIGVRVAYAQGLFPYFGFLGVVNLSSDVPNFTEGGLTRLNFGIGPALFIAPKATRVRTELYCAVPVGPSFAWIGTYGAYGVHHSYTTGRGLYYSALCGAGAYFGHHGFFLDAGYAQQSTALRHHAYLISDPSVQATERIEVFDYGLVIAAGYTFVF